MSQLLTMMLTIIKKDNTKSAHTVNQEIFIQDFFVLVIFMVFNFSFFVPELDVM